MVPGSVGLPVNGRWPACPTGLRPLGGPFPRLQDSVWLLLEDIPEQESALSPCVLLAPTLAPLVQSPHLHPALISAQLQENPCHPPSTLCLLQGLAWNVCHEAACGRRPGQRSKGVLRSRVPASLVNLGNPGDSRMRDCL